MVQPAPPDGAPAAPPEAAPEAPVRWTGRNRGGKAGHLFFFWTLRLLGPRITSWFLYFPVAYFLLVARPHVSAIGGFLDRVLGPTGFWGRQARAYKHLLVFARASLDRAVSRIFGRDAFTLEIEGPQNIIGPLSKGQPIILLSAHLGSFEVAGIVSAGDTALIHNLNIVMLDTEAEDIKDMFERLGDAHRIPKIIAVNRTSFPALAIMRALRNGEPVGLLGDRAVGGHYAMCDFLGDPAPFPTGIFAIAAAAEAPIVLTFAFNIGPQHYRVVAEPPRKVVLPRHERDAALAREAQWFADRVAHYARQHPYNWFNFFDFWETPSDGPPAPSVLPARGVT